MTWTCEECGNDIPDGFEVRLTKWPIGYSVEDGDTVLCSNCWLRKCTPTLEQIAEWVDKQKIPCDCAWRKNIKGDVILSGSNIKSYDHDGGWRIEGYPELQWVYVHCTACGYDWALHKLVNRAKAYKLHPEMYRA